MSRPDSGEGAGLIVLGVVGSVITASVYLALRFLHRTLT